ncbi:TPA: hypothetical protein DEP21_02510 [Patescibacteria group bacterium]|nr:hypothetical protein [Candidatus Gracilibacteria bacterium]
MIEIEFSSIQDSEKFKKLDRFGSEITNYKEASNAYLATHGMDKLISKTHHQTTLIKQQLRNFYNNEAKKYTQTRKKIWSDADIILQNIQNLGKSELKILEI